jgi:DNA-binding CsgD family transcriptional regulator
MLTGTSDHGKITSRPKSAEDQPEELVRLLVSQLSAAARKGTSPEGKRASTCEEVLVDVDVDGARYLLVRMPLVPGARAQLSPREQEIVRMVAQGHSNKIIADVLGISSWTVCTHLRRIFAKLSVGSRAAMVARQLESRSQTPPIAGKAAGRC